MRMSKQTMQRLPKSWMKEGAEVAQGNSYNTGLKVGGLFIQNNDNSSDAGRGC